MKILKKILSENDYTREEAENAYTSVLLDELDVTGLKQVTLGYQIKYLIEDQNIAVNKILDYYKNYFELEYFIDDLAGYDFLSKKDISILKKFLKKEVLGEINLSLETNKHGIIDVIIVNNSDENYIKNLKDFFNSYLKIIPLEAEINGGVKSKILITLES